MALLDEGLLQGNITSILDLLRRQQACCGYISAQWMTQDGGDPVFVLINPKGEITVLDGPGGTVVPNPGTLGPYPAP